MKKSNNSFPKKVSTNKATKPFADKAPRTTVMNYDSPRKIDKRLNFKNPDRLADIESRPKPMSKSKHKPVVDTSWGTVASWYDSHLEKSDDTYHAKVIFPNLLRLLDDVKGKKILDLACGQGVFTRELHSKGALVTGTDIAKELLTIAEEKGKASKVIPKITYIRTSADDLYMLKDNTFDIVICILALQNIENMQKTVKEASRVLTTGGRFIFVLNHPSFRNPRQSAWGYDEHTSMQYRRVDEYMSESHVKIDMTPGSKADKKFTVSFHRPLQVYVKALSKAGFTITHLEEWISHRTSEKGPKQRAEDRARKEIPLFMCLESKKV